MAEGLKVGDKVLTSGGIYGKITKLDGAEVTVEIASGVNVVVERMTINGVVAPKDTKMKQSLLKQRLKKQNKRKLRCINYLCKEF